MNLVPICLQKNTIKPIAIYGKLQIFVGYNLTTNKNSIMIASIQELLQKEAQAVLNIPVTDAYERAVGLIVEQIHHRKGNLVTSGM